MNNFTCLKLQYNKIKIKLLPFKNNWFLWHTKQWKFYFSSSVWCILYFPHTMNDDGWCDLEFMMIYDVVHDGAPVREKLLVIGKDLISQGLESFKALRGYWSLLSRSWTLLRTLTLRGLKSFFLFNRVLKARLISLVY